MTASDFQIGDRVIWLQTSRGGYGFVSRVRATVVKLGAKRVRVKVCEYDARKNATFGGDFVWVTPEKLQMLQRRQDDRATWAHCLRRPCGGVCLGCHCWCPICYGGDLAHNSSVAVPVAANMRNSEPDAQNEASPNPSNARNR